MEDIVTLRKSIISMVDENNKKEIIEALDNLVKLEIEQNNKNALLFVGKDEIVNECDDTESVSYVTNTKAIFRLKGGMDIIVQSGKFRSLYEAIHMLTQKVSVSKKMKKDIDFAKQIVKIGLSMPSQIFGNVQLLYSLVQIYQNHFIKLLELSEKHLTEEEMNNELNDMYNSIPLIIEEYNKILENHIRNGKDGKEKRNGKS